MSDTITGISKKQRSSAKKQIFTFGLLITIIAVIFLSFPDIVDGFSSAITQLVVSVTVLIPTTSTVTPSINTITTSELIFENVEAKTSSTLTPTTSTVTPTINTITTTSLTFEDVEAKTSSTLTPTTSTVTPTINTITTSLITGTSTLSTIPSPTTTTISGTIEVFTPIVGTSMSSIPSPTTSIIQGEPLGDAVPPVLVTPNDIVVETTDSNGLVVDFTVTATDDEDGEITPVCSNNSGDLFPIGTTTVTCTATDTAGNVTTSSFSIIVTLVSVGPVTIIDNSTGGDCTAIGIWDLSTKTCTLSSNLTEGIVIGSNGITLDGNERSITGTFTSANPGPFKEGVLVNGKTGVIIKNVLINNFSSGIHLITSNGNTIQENTLTDNGFGIQLFDSDDNQLVSNTLTANKGTYGIWFDNSNGNTVSDNTVSGAATGLLSTNSISGTITSNTFTVAGGSAIYLNGVGGYTVTNNLIDSNNSQGIQLDGGGSHTITGNTIQLNGNSGIRLTSSNNIISDNIINSNTDEGILILSGPSNTSTNNIIKNNDISSNNKGISLDGNNNQIYNNNFVSNFIQSEVLGSSSGNTFDLGSNTGGNYWNTYDESSEGCFNDSPFDIFCDDPFVFLGGQDNFPWIMENGETVPDNTPPTITTTTLNLSPTNRQLVINFDEVIDVSTTDLTKIFISPTGGINQIALTNSAVSNTVDGVAVNITLDAVTNAFVDALTSHELDVLSGAFEDISGNSIISSPNITITIIGDTIPPVIVTPNINAIEATDSNGSVVDFTVTATDDVDGNIIPVCSHNSGDLFPIGITTVICTATDFSGNSSVILFEIIVSHTNPTQIIDISPTQLKFEQGEIMKFTGTALPNESIEFVLEDPLGKEVFSDIVIVDSSGFVEFEYQTELTSTKGTYTLIATQGTEKEFIFAGLGQLPSIPINLELDKLNYKTSETAIISLTGKGSDIISLLIIDPSDKPKGESISITLGTDGRATHLLDLSNFETGVYTAVISKGNVQSSEVFTVGLQTGSGNIEIVTTKINYFPGDSILILGDTSPNVLLTITLSDPDGNEVKVKETFSDKNGKISESSFRIPSNAKIGTWIIDVKSGQNLDSVEIEVLATLSEGIQISVEKGEKVAGIGETIIIRVTGAQQTVEIEIIAEDGEIIDTLSLIASSQGEINLPWIIPKEMEPGIYTVTATDAFNFAETTFELIGDDTTPTLTTVSISLNNVLTTQAVPGDKVILIFTADQPIQNVTATISGGTATVTNAIGDTWVASRIMQANDPVGVVAFTINFENANGVSGSQVTATTDGSSVTFSPLSNIADDFVVIRNGVWFIDTNNDGIVDISVAFGLPTDKPIVGDFDGDGTDDIAVIRNGVWFVDTDNNGTADIIEFFGIGTDKLLVGDFNGDGQDDFVAVRGGAWFVDTNLDQVVDILVAFGLPTDTPFVGDFDGDGTDDITVFRDGVWFVDTDNDGTADITEFFGLPTDKPIVGDFNGDGKDDFVAIRDGTWFVDTNNDGIADIIEFFGLPTDKPIVGDFNGDGKDDFAVIRNGVWFIDTNNDGLTDIIEFFGLSTDIQLVGNFN